jgi:ATP-binding cassette subfamily C protein/ATP-binding cassette subfamily C protein EexD
MVVAMAQGQGEGFLGAVAACRRALGAAAGFSLFVNLLQLAVPLFMLQVFDRVLVGGSLETLGLLALLAVAALVAMAALDLVRARLMHRAGDWFERRLGAATFERAVLAAGGDAVGRLRDLARLRGFLASNSLISLYDSPWVPIYLGIIFLLHPSLGWVATVGAVALFALALVNEMLTRRPLAVAGAAAGRAETQALAAARNAEAVDAMGMMADLAQHWRAANAAALAPQGRATDRAAAAFALSKFARLAVQLAILAVGAVLVVHQEITAGAMIAGSIMMARALAPVEQAIGSWKELVGARAAYRRLGRLHAAPAKRAATMALPRPAGRLAVDRVALCFPGAPEPTIKGVSFEVAPGEAIAIVGPSAAGKSTLARLIVGTWRPSAGTVRLDGAELFRWDRADVGRQVGYLPQDVELFAGTVRRNIARMAEAEPADVVAAARLAGVHDMVLRLSQGYDTEIGPGGAILSAGQRQRIALARALYGRPRLVVLDEPNANLDSAGEAALVDAIGRIRRDGAAVVVVAHRPNVLQAVDRVVVLRDGAIEMVGPTEQVLARLARPAVPSAPPLGADSQPPATVPGVATGTGERRPLATAAAGDE